METDMRRPIPSQSGSRGVLRVALAFALTLAGLSFAPSAASGQEESYVSYANKLTAFERRGAQLARDINDVAVTKTYCDAARRRADGVRLAELFVALSDLRRDWSSF